jgi:hypothetical protein
MYVNTNKDSAFLQEGQAHFSEAAGAAGSVFLFIICYSDLAKVPASARTAAMMPKTMPTQLPWTKALRNTQMPREHIARLVNFIAGPPFRLSSQWLPRQVFIPRDL